MYIQASTGGRSSSPERCLVCPLQQACSDLVAKELSAGHEEIANQWANIAALAISRCNNGEPSLSAWRHDRIFRRDTDVVDIECTSMAPRPLHEQNLYSERVELPSEVNPRFILKFKRLFHHQGKYHLGI